MMKHTDFQARESQMKKYTWVYISNQG